MEETEYFYYLKKDVVTKIRQHFLSVYNLLINELEKSEHQDIIHELIE